MAIKSTIGITSACAEKSPFLYSSASVTRNYLRMRGEEGGLIGGIPRAMELPPHARRRGQLVLVRLRRQGITSACAEKSINHPHILGGFRNYLRMRGEEEWLARGYRDLRELPPHARRRGSLCIECRESSGITSACAEKSFEFLKFCDHARNYLRMRGEEVPKHALPRVPLELPPHARRRVFELPEHSGEHGITSACAEKSGAASFACMAARNYLRMRGEEGGVVLAQADTEGNYLRMRGEELWLTSAPTA